MASAIIELQTSLIMALKNDSQLLSLLGSDCIFDAPKRGKRPPYLTIFRHDIISRDGDEAPINEHFLLFHCRHNNISRNSIAQIAQRVREIVLGTDLTSANLKIIYATHLKTETIIDNKSATSLAKISFRLLSEPIN